MENRKQEKPWQDGEAYDRYIQDELNSFRKQAWKTVLTSHFPEGETLDILDLGTGPGFFACILSEEGHCVTGIDSSKGMLECARKNAERLQVTPRFLEMDLNHMTFADNSFDVIVTRNVTWTLSQPKKVYQELQRVLRPGGLLLIYDANWVLHFYDEERMKRVRAREQAYYEKYGVRETVSTENPDYYKTCALGNIVRPQWDFDVLTKMGFQVSVQEDIGEIIYGDWEKQLYGESPLFEICARKQESV